MEAKSLFKENEKVSNFCASFSNSSSFFNSKIALVRWQTCSHSTPQVSCSVEGPLLFHWLKWKILSKYRLKYKHLEVKILVKL